MSGYLNFKDSKLIEKLIPKRRKPCIETRCNTVLHLFWTSPYAEVLRREICKRVLQAIVMPLIWNNEQDKKNG